MSFPLSRPIHSTNEEQSRKGPRHNPDLSRKSGKPPGLETPRLSFSQSSGLVLDSAVLGSCFPCKSVQPRKVGCTGAKHCQRTSAQGPQTRSAPSRFRTLGVETRVLKSLYPGNSWKSRGVSRRSEASQQHAKIVSA